MNVCLVASAGGHMTQLLRVRQAWLNYPCFYITTTEVLRDRLEKQGHQVYVVGECNRNHPARVLAVCARVARTLVRERPDIVVSTGAAAGCLACLFGKLTGARIVWLDSITNVERISLSGRIVRHFADLFLVQWPELCSKYAHTQYAGAVV